MAISKEKMDSIINDLKDLDNDLEGLSEEELKEVAASAMGSNVSGVVGSAVAAGTLLAFLG